MKKYKIAFEYYPFNVEDLVPKLETVEADSLEEAFSKLEESKGKGTIEIFKEPAKKQYDGE